MLKKLNHILQKFSRVAKTVSDINAVNEATKGNTWSLKTKIKNKFKNLLWHKIL